MALVVVNVAFLLHVLCLVLTLVGILLVATADSADEVTFACVCSALVVLASWTLSRAVGVLLAPVVLAFAFFWYAVGVQIADNANTRLDNNKDDENAKKILAGCVLCLVGSILSPLVTIGYPGHARFLKLEPHDFLGLIGAVLGFVGLAIVWDEDDDVSILSIEALVALVIGLYTLFFPSSTTTPVSAFLLAFVGCGALYTGLANKGSRRADGLFLTAAGLWVMTLAFLWSQEVLREGGDRVVVTRVQHEQRSVYRRK